jgi:hypothetical protein
LLDFLQVFESLVICRYLNPKRSLVDNEQFLTTADDCFFKLWVEQESILPTSQVSR